MGFLQVPIPAFIDIAKQLFYGASKLLVWRILRILPKFHIFKMTSFHSLYLISLSRAMASHSWTSTMLRNVEMILFCDAEKYRMLTPNNLLTAMSVDSSTRRENGTSFISCWSSSLKWGPRIFFTIAWVLVRCIWNFCYCQGKLNYLAKFGKPEWFFESINIYILLLVIL